ncbi:19348_t:CDS:2, partial [Rhizophagus irregularis]
QHNVNTVTTTIITPELPSLHDQNHVLQQLSSVIASALLCDDKIKLTLIDIASKFFSYTNFQFYSDGSVSDIESRINNSNMFKVFPDILDAARLPDSSDQIRIPREQPWILLLHHLIPRDLTVFFDNYFSKAVDRSRFLLEYVSAFTSELQTITWSPRSRSFKKWEKSLDITLKKKKNYRKHTTTVSGRASSSTTTLPSAVA